jgi:multicomponent Na+:H+ antiporter subunit D
LTLAPLPIAIPLLAAGALAATDFLHRRWIADAVALLSAAATTTICAILLARAAGATAPIVYWFGAWEPHHGVALGVSLTIDALGAGMATLVSLLATGGLIFSARYFDAVSNLFQALMLVFLAAMVGFCLSGDLFNMIVFFELMSVAAYALTAYRIEERGPLQGAINFAVSNSLGAIAILFGIALLYGRTGALNLAQIGVALAGRQADVLVAVAFTLIVVGFLVKAAAVPFHFWLADAHSVAPTPVCVLFSGVMVELGVYAVARVYWTAFSGALGPEAPALRPMLLWVGALTALIGALMCFQQRHLKRLLAFSTVSHVGLFLICVALFTPAGIAAAAALVLAHGLVQAALFMCVGILIHRFAEVDELRLRGRGRDRSLMPVGLIFALGGVALAGTPMLGVFLGNSLGEAAVAGSGFDWAVAIFVLASSITAGTVLRAAGSVFGGWGEEEPPPSEQPQERDETFETLEPHDRTPITMLAPAAVLMLAGLAAGILPGFRDAVQQAGAAFVDSSAYAGAVLHQAGRYTPIEPSGLRAVDFAFAGTSIVLAVAIAATALFGRELVKRIPAGARRAGGRATTTIRDLHSGHVGDYVAWLTVGTAVLAGLVALAVA